jgi:lauroyl/myristoyl acyltransferase
MAAGMTPPQGEHEESVKGRAMLVRRPVAPARRPWVSWKDPAVLLWLACGLAFAPMRRASRLRVARLAARLATRTRRATQARARIMRMLARSEPEAGRIVRELQAGRLAGYLDVVRALTFGPDFVVSCRGLERIADARAQGRGAILWISDFVSAGDASKVALAREGLRVAHLSRPEHGFTTSRFGIRWLNPFRLAFERAYLLERIVFERHDPAPAMARIERILRHNGIVSIMASMHEGGTLAHVPFLNGALRLSLGAVRLGLLSGAPVLPVSVLPDPASDGAFEMVVGPPLATANGPREQRLLRPVCQYAGALEAEVRAHPQSWGGWRRADQVSIG